MKLISYIAALSAVLLPMISVAQKQGISGKVMWVSGNQMPGPEKTSTGSKGIKREVCIFEKTIINQTTANGVFFSEIQTKQIKKVISSPDGSFQVKLKPGVYSLFIKEDQGLFANQFDGESCIQCVTVSPGAMTEVTILVNYAAAY